jgi:hypothetical protein
MATDGKISPVLSNNALEDQNSIETKEIAGPPLQSK